MASEASAKEKLADFELEDRQRHARAQHHLTTADRFAYRLGRSARHVDEHTLKAQIAAENDWIDRRLQWIEETYQSLRAQERDLLAHVAYALAMFFGLSILIAALLVDYRIIHEFWSRAVMDQFGRLPASLKSSVYFKSGQVVFATLAFHFMLETVGERGRKIFVGFIFILTFIMLLGIGLIVANNWLPAGSTLFGVDLHRAASSGKDILASLGLASETRAPQTSGFGADDVSNIRTIVWLGSLSLIFIVVTGVGSLSLRNAVHNFQKMSGAETNDWGPERDAGGLRGSRSEKIEQLKVQGKRYGMDVENEGARNFDTELAERRRSIEKRMLDFASSYAEGLHDYQTAFFGLFATAREPKARTLLTELKETMGVIEPFIAGHIANRSAAIADASDRDNIVKLRERRRTGTDRR